MKDERIKDAYVCSSAVQPYQHPCNRATERLLALLPLKKAEAGAQSKSSSEVYTLCEETISDEKLRWMDERVLKAPNEK